MSLQSYLENLLSFDKFNSYKITCSNLIKKKNLLLQSDINSQYLLKKKNRLKKFDISGLLQTPIYIGNKIFKNLEIEKNFKYINFENINMNLISSNSILLLNSNDAILNRSTKKLKNIYNSRDDIFIVIWDFDNHHTFDLSSELALYSDLYIPTHAENISLLGQFNENISEPIFACSIQWDKKFLNKNLNKILNSRRENTPLGKHIRYKSFLKRNNYINFLSNNFDKICFTNYSYHSKSDIERLNEWVNYKAHWIVPVLKDLPNRFFDALITGGIPIIPKFLKNHKITYGLDKYITYYDYEESLNPKNVLNKAIVTYDNLNTSDKKFIYDHIVNNHHIENRLIEIKNTIFNKLDAFEKSHSTTSQNK